jgi:hypothetical protein
LNTTDATDTTGSSRVQRSETRATAIGEHAIQTAALAAAVNDVADMKVLHADCWCPLDESLRAP